MLEDTRQARKWLKDVDANLAAPMARVRRGDTNRDYYVHELALVQPHGEECARPVMIKRWYEKEGELVADVHPMRLTPERDTYVVDAREDRVTAVSLDAFLLSVEELAMREIQMRYTLLAPDRIRGTWDSAPCSTDDRIQVEY